MSKITRQKNGNYACVPNFCLRDKSISEKAKGIYAMVMAFPDDWDFSIKGLVSVCNGGESSIRAGIKELIKNGYVLVEKQRNSNGTLGSVSYTFLETKNDFPNLDYPRVENQHVDNPNVDNQAQYNIEELISNNKVLNNEKNNNNLNIIPDQNFSNFDGSQKKEVKKKEDSLYHVALDLYYTFHKEQTGAVCVITSKEGKKIKELIKFCEVNAKQKNKDICGAALDNAILYSIQWLFSNYNKWGNQFHKSIKLEMIVSNLSDIINNIKNGATTNKQQQGSSDATDKLKQSIRESEDRIRAVLFPKKD